MFEETDLNELPSEYRTAVQHRLERIEQELEAMGAER